MTASKISRPNSFLGTPAATARNMSSDNYRSQVPQNVNRTKRCLFGAPDSQDTKRLLSESLKQDRERFVSRYGFDIVKGQPVGSSAMISSSSSSSSSRSSPSREYYNRPNETRGLCKDDSKKPYTRQQHHQQQK